jgi:hypothetical protein
MTRQDFRRGMRATARAIVLVPIAFAAPALADVIDGDWCLGNVSFSISGPSIRMPGGHETKGDYSRHHFNYVVPQGEAEAGTEVIMRLLNETTVQLVKRTGGTDSEPEIWKRCQPTS